MKETFTSSRFWFMVIILIFVGLYVILGKLQASEGIAAMTLLLTGFGAGKTGQGLKKVPDQKVAGPLNAPDDAGFTLIRVMVGLCLVLGLWMTLGCAPTQLGKLAQIQASGSALRQSSTLVLDNRCTALVPSCPNGGLEKCQPYQKCRAMKLLIYGASSSLQVSIDAAASLVSIGEEKRAEALMPAIKDGYKRLLDLLEAYNVVGAVQILSGKEGATPVEVPKTPPKALPPASIPAPIGGVK